MMKIGLCLIIFFLLLSQVSARDVCGGCPAIIGETNLTFLNGSAEPLLGLITMQGPTETAGGVEKDSTILSFSNPMDSSGFPLVEATYKYWNATSQKWEVVFQKPRLEAFTTSPEAGEKVTRVARGDNITLEAETNLEIIGSQCKIDYRLVDPQGWIIGSVNGVSLLGQPIDGSGNGKVEIDTTGLQVGSYKLSIETASSCELDAEGGEHAFSIMDLDITLSADKTKQAVTKNVWFSGTTAPFKNIYLNVTAGTGSKVTFLSGYGSYTGPDKTDNISINSSSDGTYSAAARFDEVGYYEITAKIPGTEISSTVSITIEEPSVTVITEKSSYVSGEDVIIKGTATAGDYVVIAISDEVKTNNTIVKGDGTYQWIWATGPYVVPAYYTIDVWVCPPTINLSPDSTACWVPFGYDSSGGIQKYEGSGEYMYRDASTTIVIGSPYIEVEVSPAEIAQNDRVKLKGNAPGADYVYYWAFDVNGTTLGGKCISGGIAVSSDGSYEDLIPASVNENTGTITVFAQTFGRDRVYSDGTLSISDYECYHDSTTGNLANKNGAQIVATLEDNVKKAGSDDYEVYKVLTYTVSEPFVSLDENRRYCYRNQSDNKWKNE